jgi:hypothetical protein
MDWLYGLRLADLEVAAKHLARFLGPGEPHESLYLGGDYYMWQRRVEVIRLQHNRELPGELAEPDFPTYPLLVRVISARLTEPVDDWNTITSALGLNLLRKA